MKYFNAKKIQSFSVAIGSSILISWFFPLNNLLPLNLAINYILLHLTEMFKSFSGISILKAWAYYCLIFKHYYNLSSFCCVVKVYYSNIGVN